MPDRHLEGRGHLLLIVRFVVRSAGGAGPPVERHLFVHGALKILRQQRGNGELIGERRAGLDGGQKLIGSDAVDPVSGHVVRIQALGLLHHNAQATGHGKVRSLVAVALPDPVRLMPIDDRVVLPAPRKPPISTKRRAVALDEGSATGFIGAGRLIFFGRMQKNLARKKKKKSR